MALAGRSTRRAGSWLLAVGLVVTLVVVLVDASLKSRSDGSVERLSGQAWIDRVLPLVRDSSIEGQELNSVRTGWESLTATTMASELRQTANSAAATYRQASKLVPPAGYGSAAGLLDGALLLRMQGSSAAAKSVISSLTGPAPPPPTDSTALASAGQKLALGDQMYQLFTTNLRGLDVKMPASTWVSDPSLYEPTTLTAFLGALRSKMNLTPIHSVVVESFTTTPPPENTANGVEILPYSSTLSVDMVVANTGNQVEPGVTVTARVLPAVQAPNVARALGTMAPGDPVSVSVGPLYPLPGHPVTLTLTVSGSPALPPSTKTVAIEVAAPPSPTTTTTPPTTAPPTTTVPPAPPSSSPGP